jgi:hypothetical protein
LLRIDAQLLLVCWQHFLRKTSHGNIKINLWIKKQQWYNYLFLIKVYLYTVSNVLLAAFFLRPVPQEIILTPIHPVRDSSNFKGLCYHILENRLVAIENPLAYSCECGLFKVTCRHRVLSFLHPFSIWTLNMCFKWPIDYSDRWLQHVSHASRYDYQVAIIS